MDKQEKDKLMKLIEAKKQKKPFYGGDKQDIYKANGVKRKGIKQEKQGGLFDK